MNGLYILNGKEIRKAQNTFEWAEAFEKNRQLKRTDTGHGDVSTIFLGIDHSHNSKTLVLFETMIFGGDKDGFQQRYETYDEDLKGHDEVIKMLFEAEK